MNTKIILSLGATALMVSSLLAFSPDSNMKQCDGSSYKQHKMMKHHKSGKRGELVAKFMKLDLSTEQRVQIKALIKESRKDMPNPHTAFSDSSFDKAKFLKLVQQRKDAKAEHKAELIEKIYKLLDATQKKNFKTILDMQKIMKNKHMGKYEKMRKHCE